MLTNREGALNEKHVIARLKRGDINALGVLIERHQVRAIRTAFLITQDAAVAEDVVQDAFVSVYRYRASFDASRPFAPWFMRIVVNGAMKAARQRQRILDMPDEETDLDYADYLIDPAPGPDHLVETAETEDLIWTALGQLSAGWRAVITLRFYLDLSESEMAEYLAIPVGTVKSRLHAAKQHLRKLLVMNEGVVDHER